MDANKYLDLVPSGNSSKVKFMSVLRAVLQPAIEESSVIESLDDAFDLDNAAGDQLDVIGELVGASRLLPYSPVNPLVVDGERIYTRLMTDDEYKLAIRLKIARNEWDGTNESAQRIYRELLNGDSRITFTDNQDATVNIDVVGSLDLRQVEILNATGYLLVPAGIGKLVNIINSVVEHKLLTGTSITSETTSDYFILAEEMDKLFVGDIDQMDVRLVERKDVRKLEK